MENFVNQPIISHVFKIGVLTLLIFFLLFLLVILKQIRSMNTIVTQPDLFPIIQTSLFLLIAFVIFVFLLGIVIL